jgi:hypothetical protein
MSRGQQQPGGKIGSFANSNPKENETMLKGLSDQLQGKTEQNIAQEQIKQQENQEQLRAAETFKQYLQKAGSL